MENKKETEAGKEREHALVLHMDAKFIIFNVLFFQAFFILFVTNYPNIFSPYIYPSAIIF